MALIGGGAAYRCSWEAETGLAGIADSAGIAVTAGCVICFTTALIHFT
jgi:hypothetical protein